MLLSSTKGNHFHKMGSGAEWKTRIKDFYFTLTTADESRRFAGGWSSASGLSAWNQQPRKRKLTWELKKNKTRKKKQKRKNSYGSSETSLTSTIGGEVARTSGRYSSPAKPPRVSKPFGNLQIFPRKSERKRKEKGSQENRCRKAKDRGREMRIRPRVAGVGVHRSLCGSRLPSSLRKCFPWLYDYERRFWIKKKRSGNNSRACAKTLRNLLMDLDYRLFFFFPNSRHPSSKLSRVWKF